MRRIGPGWIAVAAIALALAPGGARGDESPDPETGIPPDEGQGTTIFPRGDVFVPLVADPKAEGSFISFFNGHAPLAFGSLIGSVGIGDQLGILRWRSGDGRQAFQASVSGNVYSQFNVEARPTGLINSDYSLGIPLAYRNGRFSSRLRIYHQSSHLGDGLLQDVSIRPEGASYEAADVVLATGTGPWRFYGGGEYRMAGRQLTHTSRLTHWGVEVRQHDPIRRSGLLASTRALAGLDVKSSEDAHWNRSWSVRAGFEVARMSSGRSWKVLAEYFEGPSPFGQFVSERISYLGFGLHLGL